jgi:hypothetical protein
VSTCASGVVDTRTKSTAVGLDHQQPGGERQVRAEPFGAVNGAFRKYKAYWTGLSDAASRTRRRRTCLRLPDSRRMLKVTSPERGESSCRKRPAIR